jgi:hypothetical protein
MGEEQNDRDPNVLNRVVANSAIGKNKGLTMVVGSALNHKQQRLVDDVSFVVPDLSCFCPWF